jgi:cyanophycin synthetase
LIKYKSVQHLFWRNRFSNHPVALVTIDFAGTFWEPSLLPTDALPILHDRFSAFRAGVWKPTAGAFLATLCLSMQQEKYGVPAVAGATESQFWFSSADLYFAHFVTDRAIAFLNVIVNRPQITADDLRNAVRGFVDDCEPAALDPSTRIMVAQANSRRIPWFRIGHPIRDIQLGQGDKQRRIRETLRSNESGLASYYAHDKALTCSLLSAVKVPVGTFAAVSAPDDAASAAQTIGFPVVLKPNFGSKGRDVIIGLNDSEAVRAAARRLLPLAQRLLVQSLIPGDDHRILVVSGRAIAAARRTPAKIVGDGKRTIADLIAAANTDPRRGKGAHSLMPYIEFDDEMNRVLTAQGFTLSSVPHAGAVVRLRLTGNISTGGTSVDVTAVMHPDNARLAERAALTLGLTVAGIDFITPDIAQSWHEFGGAICDVNAIAGLRVHLLANPSRDVVGPVFDTIFPRGDDGRIPIALITGTNGNAATSQILEHILRAQGHIVGRAATDGVTINGETIVNDDMASTNGASIVLREPTVSAAVLEIGRVDIIERGIYIERCEVAALVNIDRQQMKADGAETVEIMTQLNRKVLEIARDAVILNADDADCLELSRQFSTNKLIFFSLNSSNPDVQGHVAKGGVAITLGQLDGQNIIVVRARERDSSVFLLDSMLAPRKALIQYSLANALAASALAYGMKVPIETIAAGLSEFCASFEQSPDKRKYIAEDTNSA